jgi:DNA-binding NarL/FixJ family response regulator
MSIRLLIVDDNEQFRSVASELLAMRGFELVNAVADGDAALRYVKGLCPDAVLLDVNLPGRDSFSIGFGDQFELRRFAAIAGDSGRFRLAFLAGQELRSPRCGIADRARDR